MSRFLQLGFIALLLAGALAAPGEARAQLPDLVKSYDLGLRAIDTGEYQKGIQVTTRVIDSYKGARVERIGPVFGHFHFIRGILHIRAENLDAAIRDFQTCFNYDNDELLNRPPGDEDTRLPNRYRAVSLVQWANCLAGKKNYGAAIAKYNEALNHDERVEGMAPINPYLIHLNIGRCHLEADQLPQGEAALERIIATEGLPVGYQRYAVELLFSLWSPKSKWADVERKVHTHGQLLLDDHPSARYARNPIFYFLASDAFDKNEPMRALLWYTFLVSPNETEEAFRERIAALEETIATTEDEVALAEAEKDLTEARKNLREEHARLASLLPAVGSAHFSLNNFWGAYSTFAYLSHQYPKHKTRDDILYNAVHAAVQIEEWDGALDHGLVFIDEFPEHELVAEVARLLCEIAFIKERYEDAYDISSQVRTRMKLGSPERDIPDFVNGASLYLLGDIEGAEAELDSYVENYPKGARREMGRYLRCSCKVALQKWLIANPLLDSFLRDYPDSTFRSSALYQSGLSHVILDELDRGQDRVDELQERYPGADEIPASYNLKGDIMLGRGGSTYEELVEVFTTARDLAYAKGPAQDEVAAYSHLQLINANNEVEDWEAVGTYYDAFLDRHPESQWEVDVSIGSINALVETDRVEEAYNRIVGFVNANAKDAAGSDLSQMFGTYVGFLQDNYISDERLRRLREFPAIADPTVPVPLTALLLIAEIEELEKIEDPEKRPGEEEINSLYYQIDIDMALPDIPNYVLVRLGRWQRDVRGKTVRAREIYDYVIDERPEGGFIENALLDRAEMDLASGSPDHYDSALATFEQLLIQFDHDPKLCERATLGLARILSDMDKFEDAQPYWEAYLDGPGWNLARPEANFRYGECLHRNGDEAEALKVYVSVYANFAGHLDYSTEAYLRSANLLHGRGKLRESVMVLQDMLRRMGHLDHRNISRARTLFDQYKADFLATR